MAVTWIAVTGVLLVILLASQLARVLSQAAASGFPRDVVFALLGLTVAGYLSVIVPIGFFLSIMLGLGRLYHQTGRAAQARTALAAASDLYRAMDMTLWLPQAEAALAQVEGQ